MEQNKIYELIIERIIDNTREELLMCDEEYLRLESKRFEMEKQHLEVIPVNIQKYIDLSHETDMRIADLSYCAGIKDTISLLSTLGFFTKKY